MEFTGELYFFYTEKPISNIFIAFKKEISYMNYLSDYTNEYSQEGLFCYKNKEMFEYHLETGYNTDINGEGCFYIEARKAKFHGIASLFEYNDCLESKPYDNVIFLYDNTFSYTVTLPSLIEDCKFSLKIYNLFKNTVKSCILSKPPKQLN